MLGASPRAIALLLAPTALAVALDLALRVRSLVGYPPFEALNYTGAVFLSAGLWGGPMWLASRLFLSRRLVARAGLVLFYGAFVAPLAAFSYGGQLLHFRVFHSYMSRDTVRLGIALRGHLGEWLSELGGWLAFAAIAAGGVVLAVLFARLVKRAAPSLAEAKPILPIVGFLAATSCLWFDAVESRAMQSATPDACFAHGVVHALRDGLEGKGWVRRGVSVRTPEPLPPLPRAEHRPNVVLVVSESVRADAMCSAPPPACKARFLDESASDRVPLGRVTMQSPGTLSACMLLWTGLPPTADFATSHRAPTLWEVARAVGYHTAYVTAQNMQYQDFGLFVQRAGIDEMLTASDLGDIRGQQVGAPDERATARMLELLRRARADTPTFAVLHLSNTHAPYRVERDLEPFSPHSDDPLGAAEALHNHYRNSVLLQERTVAAFVKALRELPSFDDTVLVFVSDHGEQFREHGGLYHIHTLFDEEVRVPGWLVAGPRALGEDRRAALASWEKRRTYSQDVNATILDLFGVLDARQAMPFAKLLTGRSLVRAAPAEEATAILSTQTGVWEPDVLVDGVMRGDRLLAGAPKGGGWHCWRIASDPGEHEPLAPKDCGGLLDAAWRAFPNADVR